MKKPHDAPFKMAFAIEEVAESYLESELPAGVSVVPGSLLLSSDSYAGGHLVETFIDVVYSASLLLPEGVGFSLITNPVIVGSVLQMSNRGREPNMLAPAEAAATGFPIVPASGRELLFICASGALTAGVCCAKVKADKLPRKSLPFRCKPLIDT